MGILAELDNVIERCQEEHLEDREPSRDFEFPENANGVLVQGDSLDFMRYLAKDKGYAGAFKCIYVDPPFFTEANYDATLTIDSEILGKMPKIKVRAYEDKWSQGLAGYLEMMTRNLLLMKDLLSEEGLLFVHLDWHSVYHVKILLDELFGEDNFVNEIIWQYKSGGASKRHFARKHDTILVYAKSKKYTINLKKEKSYNRGLKPYRFKGVEEFCDDVGWYTMVNPKDVWSIDMVGRTSSERTGYATQKPIALIKKIIESASDEGDLCGDFFGGSGSFAQAAAELGRKWVSCDAGSLAMATAQERLTRLKIDYESVYSKKLEEQFAKKKIICEGEFDVFGNFLATKYEAPRQSIPVEDKHFEVVERLMREDPQALIKNAIKTEEGFRAIDVFGNIITGKAQGME